MGELFSQIITVVIACSLFLLVPSFYMTASKSNSVRIISGTLRGRKVSFPDGEGLRPTKDQVRETLFNWLQFEIPGKQCLDLFAGSGVLGIECLSRGAQSVTFIEKNPTAANGITASLAQLELTTGHVVCGDSLKWLNEAEFNGLSYDLIFLDPPFAQKQGCELVSKLLSKCLLKDEAKVYFEASEDPSAFFEPKDWQQIKLKKTGGVYYGLWRLLKKDI